MVLNILCSPRYNKLVVLVYQYVLDSLVPWKWTKRDTGCLTRNQAGCSWTDRCTMTELDSIEELCWPHILKYSDHRWYCTLHLAVRFIQQIVYSVFYRKDIFSSFFFWIFCRLISVRKEEQTFAYSKKKNLNKCTHMHPFTLSICCFYCKMSDWIWWEHLSWS